MRLGYIGLKNRSQQDINTNMRVNAALEEEKAYFASHPIYSTIQQENLGTANSTLRCTRIMFTHIKSLLPEIQKEIKDKVKDVDDRLKDLGPAMEHDHGLLLDIPQHDFRQV